ncbi:MAG: TIGR04283 family arsenosugar biosynthesis glycosyltransferase [Gammaproteobacteria bacterium]|nr:TIGR04283 family arsenosugar biosynthesis glycosyltransferase [Gammaproteobacteria bacterium]
MTTLHYTRPLLSVIIPVLNEAAAIVPLLKQLQSWRPAAEIIVVDGGSQDASAELARDYCDRVLVTAPGRALQMNTGAEHAQGTTLFFLHSDTRPDITLTGLQQLLVNKPLWGFFRVRLSGHAWPLRLVETMMNLRSRLTRIATGDQLLFVRRTDFLAMAGYADIPLMEDVELCRRLRRHTSPRIATAVVTTSSRRWEERGIFSTVLTMWRLRLAYWLGVSPRRLVKTYYG